VWAEYGDSRPSQPGQVKFARAQVTCLAEFDELLAQVLTLSPEGFTESVTLIGPTDTALTVAQVDGGFALCWVYDNGLYSYSSRGPGVMDDDEALVCFAYHGDYNEVPASYVVPGSLARLAIAQFMAAPTGTRPDVPGLAWVQD